MSKPRNDQQDRELLAWAAAKLAEAQASGMYGTLSFILEAGNIVRTETKISDKPPTPQR